MATEGLVDEARAARASLWIDTNVMHEIMGQGDLFRDFICGPRKTERRRILLQGSLWFAMVLDDQVTTTLCYRHEVEAGMVRIAPPHTDAGVWSAVATHLLQPYVFPRWDGLATNDGQEIFEDRTISGRQRNNRLDALIVQRCRERGLTLVSRDTNGPIAEARAARTVPVLFPEEYAQLRMPHRAARRRFMQRLCIGAIHRITEPDRDRRGTIRDMQAVMRTYASLWGPARERPSNPPLSLEWPWRTEF